MPEYRITDKAGEYIAGRKAGKPGDKVFLTEREAAHDLRVGALAKALDEIHPTPAPEPEPEPERKPGGKKGGVSA